jgi:hypothetical protein
MSERFKKINLINYLLHVCIHWYNLVCFPGSFPKKGNGILDGGDCVCLTYRNTKNMDKRTYEVP